jgi:hypothetical protein
MTARDKQAQWSRQNEQRRIDAGGRRLPGGVLNAQATAALSVLLDSGYAPSVTGCIARALVEAGQRASVAHIERKK